MQLQYRANQPAAPAIGHPMLFFSFRFDFYFLFVFDIFAESIKRPCELMHA